MGIANLNHPEERGVSGMANLIIQKRAAFHAAYREFPIHYPVIIALSRAMMRFQNYGTRRGNGAIEGRVLLDRTFNAP